MNAKTREFLVSRRELERLVVNYRHLLEEHRRAHPRSHTRHRLERELVAVSSRFERLLTHTAIDEETRTQWRASLHHASPPPSGPEPGAPLLFSGR